MDDVGGADDVGAVGGRGGARQRVGRRGEDLAAAELQRQGLEILERNWRCAIGEIDIVARERTPHGAELVFCEVKSRTGLGYGDPLESITWAKLRRLRQLAAEWMAVRLDGPHQLRLDAIGVVLLPGREPQLTHVRAIG